MSQNKRILFFGYHDLHGARAVSLKKHYENEGYEVIQCHTDKAGVIGKYRDLARKFHHKKEGCDAMVVMFAGHYLMPLAWYLTRGTSIHLYFDAFVSIFDTKVNDRQLVSLWNPLSWIYLLADIVSTHLADTVLLDTEAHKQYFIDAFYLSPKRVDVIYLDAVSDLFFPGDKKTNTKQLDVLFFGNFIPLQGVATIIKAASLVEREDANIHFTLVGSGQTFEDDVRLAEKLEVENVTFAGRLPFEKLPDRIRQADLCLGIFGESDKAHRVIPHKVYEAVACGIPVITMDSEGIREKFADHPLVTLCQSANATSLKEKILRFKKKQ